MDNLINYFLVPFEHKHESDFKSDSQGLKRLKNSVFGPIERIYEVHKDIFHPKLVVCKDDVIKFSNSIETMCKDGTFSIYMVQALDEQDSKFCRDQFHSSFMNNIQLKHGVSYDFRPIQQLAKYHLTFIDILKELSFKENGDQKQEILAVSRAEYELKKIMSQIYEARFLL